MSESSFWHWPGIAQLRYAMLLALAQSALFIAVYGGADWLTHQHAYRLQMHTNFDLSMPFVPALFVVYLSLNPLLWMTPFVLRSRRQLEAISLALAASTLVAGLVFVSLPAADAFERPSEPALGVWVHTYAIARALALRHNYFPSLHVAFTVICVLAFQRQATFRGQVLLAAWGMAIVASTVLTHQHYLLDVASGLLLGWAAEAFVYRTWSTRNANRASQESSASPTSCQEQRV